MSSIIKTNIFGIIIFCFLSCYSNQTNINNLIDYSVTESSDMTYDIGITIYNKNLSSLNQNIKNEIIKMNGKIRFEKIENINRYRILVDIPQKNTAEFIGNIKKFGIVVNESMGSNNDIARLNFFKERIIQLNGMLEINNGLLKNANTITDKLLLEKEIMKTKEEISGMESSIKQSESRIGYNNITIEMNSK
jgi:hypothetical protein